MKLIQDTVFGGERPLYTEKHLCLRNVVIEDGESALKETADIVAEHCEFKGKYPFWECDGFIIKDCIFREGARAALWYSRGCKMTDTLVEAPKMFRDIEGVELQNVRFPNALETFWNCKDIKLRDVEVEKGDYIYMGSSDIDINGYRQLGNYSFQYTKRVTIRNAYLETKDAFWETEDVTVYDSEIHGEYLGWYSKRLRLVRCHITGTQPLCYCDDLVLEDCTFGEDADLAFEYSSVDASIRGSITSVKNPRSGRIIADGYGEIILDQNIKAPGNCQIQTRV